jgi:putative membrane protein
MQNHHELPALSYYVIHWVVSSLALFLTAKVVPGIRIKGFLAAMLGSVVIGVGYVIFWWPIFFLTLPINILTLGLFTFIVNALVLKICAVFVPGFEIKGWFSAILGWIVLTVFSITLHYFLL